MRTAEDIVQEYQGRGYDEFRIRAIAALRPEPMQSQILAILDTVAAVADEEEPMGAGIETVTETLETPSKILAALTPDESMMAEPAPAEIDTLSAEQAVTIELQESAVENTEEESEASSGEEGFSEEADSSEAAEEIDTTDEEDDSFWSCEETEAFDEDDFEPVAPIDLDAQTIEEELPLAVSSEAASFEEVDVPEEAVQETVVEAELSEQTPPWHEVDQALRRERNAMLPVLLGAINAVTVELCQTLTAASTLPQAIEAAETPAAPMKSLTDESLSESMLDESILAELEEDGNNILDEVLAEWDQADAINLDTNEDTPALEYESPRFEVVRHEGQDVAQEDDDDSRILYAFDNTERFQLEEGDEDDSSYLEVIDAKSEGSEWVDCGSGLILMPKSMNDAFDAVADALQDQPIIAGEGHGHEPHEESLDELIQAIDDCETQLDAMMVGDDVLAQLSTEEVEETEAAVEVEYRLSLGMERFLQQPLSCDLPVVESTEEVEDPDLSEEELVGLLWPQACEAEAVPVTITMVEGMDEEEESEEPDYNEQVEQEIAQLERHLEEIASVVRYKDKELGELNTLVAEKDEILALQMQQVEEERARRAELDAELLELSVAGDRLRIMTSNVTSLQAQLAEAERERNVLKTDTIPALEEQQLSLVELMEEEAGRGRRLSVENRRYRRRTKVCTVLASAACVVALLVPTLGILQGEIDLEKAAQPLQELALTPQSDAERKVDDLMKRVAQLENEKAALNNLAMKVKADAKHREGVLLSQCNELKAKMEKERLTLVADLNRLQQQSERWNERRALADSQGTRSSNGTGRVVPAGSSARAAVASATVRVVKSGDSFSEIVREHYGTANRRLQKKVAKFNQIENPNAIFVGQKIRLVALAPEDD
ncbi:MAG: LysM peptidoglycan-binding domain-containing protein [Planctomycetota bacterium]